jgi:uncharacterized protein (DUF2384 family)
MGIPKRKSASVPLPSIEALVRELIDKPDEWLDTPHDQLGGDKPRDLVGTSRESVLRNLLEAVKHGSFS